jgi:hypothetical protein
MMTQQQLEALAAADEKAAAKKVGGRVGCESDGLASS